MNELELFKQIRHLVTLDLTQHEIAEVCGIERSMAQPRINLARLPAYVQKEYMKLMLGHYDQTVLRWADVAVLYEAHGVGNLRKTFNKLKRNHKRLWQARSATKRADLLQKIAAYLGPTRYRKLLDEVEAANGAAVLAQQGPAK